MKLHDKASFSKDSIKEISNLIYDISILRVFNDLDCNGICGLGVALVGILWVLIIWNSGGSWLNSWSRSWWAHSSIDKTPSSWKMFSHKLLFAPILRLFGLWVHGVECVSEWVGRLIREDFIVRCCSCVWSKGSIWH